MNRIKQYVRHISLLKEDAHYDCDDYAFPVYDFIDIMRETLENGDTDADMFAVVEMGLGSRTEKKVLDAIYDLAADMYSLTCPKYHDEIESDLRKGELTSYIEEVADDHMDHFLENGAYADQVADDNEVFQLREIISRACKKFNPRRVKRPRV